MILMLPVIAGDNLLDFSLTGRHGNSTGEYKEGLFKVHPSMLFACGVINSGRIDKKIMAETGV